MNHVRGYTVESCLAYIDAKHSGRDRERIAEKVPDDVRRGMSDVSSMGWYPVEYLSAHLAGIVSVYEGDEQKTYEALVACGMFMAERATNTFMKLAMRIMTPAMFSKKAPDLWARDFKFGRMESDTADLEARHIVVHLRGISCYPHGGPVAGGFATFALTAMGVKGLKIKQSGWSLAAPSPEAVSFDIRWQ